MPILGPPAADHEETQVRDLYYGSFARFDTPSKKDAAQLLGADNLVGDVFEIEFRTEGGQRVAWMRNRFGALVGFFGQEASRQLSLCEARGWRLHAILSFVAYSESPEPGHYWGESALVCFDPAESGPFDVFLAGIAGRMAEGARPDIGLGGQGVAKVLESKGSWSPTRLVPLPPREQGTAFVKTRRSVSEKLIEQARKRNKGCYLVSWLFLLAVVAGILFGLKACGVF